MTHTNTTYIHGPCNTMTTILTIVALILFGNRLILGIKHPIVNLLVYDIIIAVEKTKIGLLHKTNILLSAKVTNPSLWSLENFRGTALIK